MGCFMEGWGLHGERPPLWHISLLPLLPLPYPLSLQAAFPITTAFFLPSWQVESWEMPHGAPLPMAHPSPGLGVHLSPLEQPRGRAPRAGARCRSALSRGRTPPRSFCSVSSTSLTELTSRAMLVWLSERSCRWGTRDGAMSWG